MSRRLYLGTRKGLFVLERGGSGRWEMASTAFLADPVSMLLPGSGEELYVALNLGHFGVKLHRSEDGGRSFQEVAVPTYPKAEEDEVEKAPSLKQIWCLEDDGAGGLWAGTIPGGLFRSRDRGESWELNRALWEQPGRERWFGGGYDHPGIHSIALHPDAPGRLTVGVSCGGVWVSDDGGESWEARTKGMFAAYMPPEQKEDPEIQDPHRLVQCPSRRDAFWVQHHNGVFRSTDDAASWREIEVPPSSFGFAVAVHPEDPDTAWTVPLVKDECRIPVDGRMVVARTRDGGDSFELLHRGLPQEHAYDVVYRHGLEIDREGKCLAMGSTSGGLWISEDRGESWSSPFQHLPPIYCLRFG